MTIYLEEWGGDFDWHKSYENNFLGEGRDFFFAEKIFLWKILATATKLERERKITFKGDMITELVFSGSEYLIIATRVKKSDSADTDGDGNNISETYSEFLKIILAYFWRIKMEKLLDLSVRRWRDEIEPFSKKRTEKSNWKTSLKQLFKIIWTKPISCEDYKQLKKFSLTALLYRVVEYFFNKSRFEAYSAIRMKN